MVTVKFALTTAALAVATTSVYAAAKGNAFVPAHAPSTLEGSWQVTIRPHDCTSGAEAPPEFWNFSYFTFVAGGTLFETTSNPRFLPGQRGPGHGHWARTGHDTYQAALQAFIQFDTDPPAVPTYVRGSTRIEQSIEMIDHDHWVSVADVRFRDVNGDPVSNGCASAVATRMH